MEQEQNSYVVGSNGDLLMWSVMGISTIIAIYEAKVFFQGKDTIALVSMSIWVVFTILSIIAARKENENWIRVTGTCLHIYKKRKLIETLIADEVVCIIKYHNYGFKGQLSGKTVLYGEGGRELITLGLKPDNMDRLIELIGRDKLLIEKFGNMRHC